MSDLLIALNFIDEWVRKYMPSHPAKMSQGLSQGIIDDKVKALLFQLPKEIYDLYQWRNGGTQPFIPHPDGWDLAHFFSLEEAINAANNWSGSFNLFPLFTLEDGGYFIICSQEKCEVSPVYCNDIIPSGSIDSIYRYSSLTSMMQELVEQLKTDSRTA